MGTWHNERTEESCDFEVPALTLEVTDNPVIAELYGPDGQVTAQVRERPPIGFCR